jgi:hypothetical protein
LISAALKIYDKKEVAMDMNWGPQLIVSPLLNKGNSKKVILNESVDFDLLRQDLIAGELRFDVLKVNNLWYYRRKSNDGWRIIGESTDIENGFPVEWDINTLKSGKYEVMGRMQIFSEEDCLEKLVTERQSIAEVTVKN